MLSLKRALIPRARHWAQNFPPGCRLGKTFARQAQGNKTFAPGGRRSRCLQHSIRLSAILQDARWRWVGAGLAPGSAKSFVLRSTVRRRTEVLSFKGRFKAHRGGRRLKRQNFRDPNPSKTPIKTLSKMRGFEPASKSEPNQAGKLAPSAGLALKVLSAAVHQE